MNEVVPDVEMQVADIWKTLLSVSEIAPSQTFFELGGDSLLMIDMLVQVNQTFGIEVDPGSLFEEASLRGFSKLVELSLKGDGDVERGSV